MTGASVVLARAVQTGLVRSDETLAGRVHVEAIGASNMVHRLSLDGDVVAYVKSTGRAAALDGDDSVARETLVLRLLAGNWAAPEVLPATWGDELWLSPIAGRNVADLAVAGDVPAMSEAFAALGFTLAGLHRMPVPAGAPELRWPWPLLDELPAHMETARFHEVPSRVIETARALPDVMAAARTAWRTSTWTHGDVSPMNTIIAADGHARLIDWEGAGIGDPAWDLAGAELMARQLAPGWESVAIARLRHSYQHAGGPALEPGPATACVRTLVAAYQQAAGAFAVGTIPDADGGVTLLLEKARMQAETHRTGVGRVRS